MMNDLPIPKLPGYTVNSPPTAGATNTRKQTLKYMKGYAQEGEGVVLVEDKKAPDTTGLPTGQYITSTLATQGAVSPDRSTMPRWVEYDRMVLRFFGYFKEAVVESAVENHRVRKVVLQYYVTDGTIQVIEPKQDNSGIPQGTFLKRHRVERSDGGGYVNATDLQVGSEVDLYGRTYYLTDADEFTRDFMAKEFGIELNAADDTPDDPYDVYRESMRPTGPPDNEVKTYTEAMLGKATHVLAEDRLRQFMDFSRRVLRFYCVWDDRQRLYGDRRPYVLHYFLEDDTVEILEVNEPNCGRDPFPQFLKRGPLPKGLPLVPDVTVKPKKDQCYTPLDLRIGGYVSVHGRPFLLHDCDEFTRHFYINSMGYDGSEMEAINVQEVLPTPPKHELPPYNGFGSYEDSKQNCTSLLPKPPTRDFAKLMNKDKQCLRFSAVFKETAKNVLSNADKDRRFVITYFLSDDTLSVFEPPVRNSGIIGGKFLERQKVYVPGSRTTTYGEQDLYVGNVLDIYNREFELVDADEYSYQYMENNKHIYVRSDADSALRNLAQAFEGKEEEIRNAVIEHDKDGSGRLTADSLKSVLEAVGIGFSKMELITVVRHVSQQTGHFNLDALLAELQAAQSR